MIDDYDSSINCFNQLVELLNSEEKPNKEFLYKAKFELSKIYFKLKMFEEAIYILEEIPNEYKTPDAIYYLSKSYVSLGSYNKFIVFIEDVTDSLVSDEKLNYFANDIKFLLSLVYRDMGKYEISLDVLEKLYNSNISNSKLASEFLFNIAKVYELNMNKQKALETYLELINKFENSKYYFRALEKYNQLK